MRISKLLLALVAAFTVGTIAVAAPVQMLASDVTVNSSIVLTESTGSVESLGESVDVVTDIATSLLEVVTSNPILMVFFAAPLIGIAVGVIRKFKKT